MAPVTMTYPSNGELTESTVPDASGFFRDVVEVREANDAPGDLPRWYATTQTTPSTGAADEIHEEIHFSMALERYFAAEGIDQKRARQDMVLRMKQSSCPRKRIQQVLQRVIESPTEHLLISAIDLLGQGGQDTTSLAIDMVFGPAEEVDTNAAFMLASAAGRADKEMIHAILIPFGQEAMREAAVELLPNLPPVEAKVLLRQRARDDESSYIRSRATELLEDFD